MIQSVARRKRPRNNKPITEVLAAFQKDYGDDLDAYESMLLSMSPGTGIEVHNGKLRMFDFSPATEQGAYYYSKRN